MQAPRAHLAGMPPNTDDLARIGQPSAYRKHARAISARLHTADVVVPSHIRDPGGEPGCLTSLTLGIPARRMRCCEHERAAGLSASMLLRAINRAEACSEALHSAASTIMGAIVQRGSKAYSAASTTFAGVVIGSRLRDNAGPSVFCLVLSERAESWGWSSLTSIQSRD